MRVFRTALALTIAATAISLSAQSVPEAIGKLPVYFVENRGQWPGEVAYSVQGATRTLWFTKSGLTIRLREGDREAVVKLDFVDANAGVVVTGEEPQAATVSYFIGDDPAQWKRALPTVRKIVYRDLWPGIDLEYSGHVDRLKYAFVVRPGADPARIRLRYRGADRVEMDTGALCVVTGAGKLIDPPPVSYQHVGDRRSDVVSRYELIKRSGGAITYGFAVGAYDRQRSLVIDPVMIVYCGYVGGEDWDSTAAIAVDQFGNAYITGITGSSERTFPVRVGPGANYSSSGDVFVCKVNATGTSLVYAGYIGGPGHDEGAGIAVDAAGAAYVVGPTIGIGFPRKQGPANAASGAFVAKVAVDGSDLIYSGVIGGTGKTNAAAVAVDGTGRAVLCGSTVADESTFPVRIGPGLTHSSPQLPDVFVARVNAQGTGLDYCGFVGGQWTENPTGIALDRAGNAYVVGVTCSDEQTFPVTVGPDLTFNDNCGLSFDVFVCKVDRTGSSLHYCGYIGGSWVDNGNAIAVDSTGNAYVTGWTLSPPATLPLKVGPSLSPVGAAEIFVAKVNATGAALDYCGFIAGQYGEAGEAIAVDADGAAYVAGWTGSDQTTFPVRDGPDPTHNGASDGFIAKVRPDGTGLAFCGYLGGDQLDVIEAIALGPTGAIYVAGNTQSKEATFPVKVGPDLTYNETVLMNQDTFVAKLDVTRLELDRAPRPGETANLTLIASADANRAYGIGSSFGTGPIAIDTRSIGLAIDPLLALSLSTLAPQVFAGYRGTIGADGRATAAIVVPPIAALTGVAIHTAFVTFAPNAPSGIASISNTASFTIAP